MPTSPASSSSGKATSSSTNPKSRADKSNKPSKIVVLKLRPALLGTFVSESKAATKKASKVNSEPSAASTPAPAENDTTGQTSSPTRDPSDGTATPVAGTDASKKKGGPKAGMKRSFANIQDGGPKGRGKPGPKKRMKMDNENGKPLGTTTRLGPKANQGAINAGLRALDRSGAPCRKWERRPFVLKSFTGVSWELPAWRAPKHVPKEDDDKTASQEGSKVNDSSTARGSDIKSTGENGVDGKMSVTPAASSPAPVAVAPTAPAIAASG